MVLIVTRNIYNSFKKFSYSFILTHKIRISILRFFNFVKDDRIEDLQVAWDFQGSAMVTAVPLQWVPWYDAR